MNIKSGQRVLSKKTAVDNIYEILKERIIAGQYPAETRLRQDALAKDLGTSRIPVREALFLLEGDGLVEFQPHRGAVVKPLSVDEVRELFRLRAMLECDMLEHAIPNMTDKDIEDAEDALAVYDKAVDSGVNTASWSELNWKFHWTLYSPGNTPITMALCRSLHDNTDRYQRLQISMEGQAEKGREEHADILQACRDRDVEKATRLMAEHILTVGDIVTDFISANQDGATKED